MPLFAYNPTDGYRNVTDFPQKPPSEAAFRDSMQSLLDQIRDYINGNVAVKTLEALIAPTFLNSWSYIRGGYYKDNFGIVHYDIGISGGVTTSGTKIFSFPAGYLPETQTFAVFFASSSGDPTAATVVPGSIRIDANGDVILLQGGFGYMFLCGSFRAAT